MPNLDLFYWIFGGILYIGGACVYMLRIPERLFPNKFDIFVIQSLFIFLGIFALDIPYMYSYCSSNALLCCSLKFLQQVINTVP